MNKIDQLLEERLRYSRALAQNAPKEPDSMLTRAVKRCIYEIDIKLKRESACSAADADLSAAYNAIEKAEYSENEEQARTEFQFYWTRANYKFLKRSYGAKEAEEYLLEQSKVIGIDITDHIRKGTIPDF